MEPTEILADALKRAEESLGTQLIKDKEIVARIKLVAEVLSNRSGIRVLLACALAKAENPKLDIRRPYDKIGDAPKCKNNYSGRVYDESYITPFRANNKLPFIATTAFLTPAWRTKNVTLTTKLDLKGTPPEMYKAVLQVLDDIQNEKVTADDVLAEAIRLLILMRNHREEELKSALGNLKNANGRETELAAEAIVTLIEQHLKSPRSSRLPVLVVAAAYCSASEYLQRKARPLQSHNAADEQTGAYGDVEITLPSDDQVVTAYEMKDKRVSIEDLRIVVEKIAERSKKEIQLDNYIIITTYPVEKIVQDYAASLYEVTGGIEVVVLDCVAFIRHFLHLFHNLRTEFLDEYQRLVLGEPDNTVRKELKLTLLTLRRASESASEAPPEAAGEQP